MRVTSVGRCGTRTPTARRRAGVGRRATADGFTPANYGRRVITSFDDYPIHPSSSPIAETGTANINHYDRYFFNGYRRDGSLYFGVAMGLYPNRHVADAAFSVVVEGRRQISVHASRRAPHDRRDANRVGPIEVRILEPMRSHRITVDTSEVRADLLLTARSGPVQEPHFLTKAGQRTVFDYTRLTQFGRWSGWIEVEGRRFEIDEASSYGSRDRSWGVRPIGHQSDLGAPVGGRQFFWLWGPVNFPDFATHFDVNEYEDGSRWHQVGLVVNDGPWPDGPPPTEASSIGYRGRLRTGTRWFESFELDLGFESRRSPLRLEFEPLYEFQMMGIGYLHPEWGHGVWKGEDVHAVEAWDLPVTQPLSPSNVHIQAVCRVRAHDDDRTHEGLGILEQLIIGPHQPSGVVDLFDGAP